MMNISLESLAARRLPAVDVYIDQEKALARAHADAARALPRLLAAQKQIEVAHLSDLFFAVGECPSGPTYGPRWVWDGSEGMADAILEHVYHQTFYGGMSLCHVAKEGSAAVLRRIEYRRACTTGD